MALEISSSCMAEDGGELAPKDQQTQKSQSVGTTLTCRAFVGLATKPCKRQREAGLEALPLVSLRALEAALPWAQVLGSLPFSMSELGNCPPTSLHCVCLSPRPLAS